MAESWTDAENAQMFATVYRKKLIYTVDNGWYFWNKRYWQQVPPEMVLGYMDKFTRERIYDFMGNSSDDKAQTRNAILMGGYRRITGALELSKSYLIHDSLEFNKDSHLLNVANGIVNLKTGELKHHHPNEMISEISKIEYDATTNCPEWRNFLSEIFQENQELIDYIQREVGYSLTGETTEQSLRILVGAGNNGKSTFLNVLRYVLSSYGRSVDSSSLLTRRRGGSHSEDIARLAGARLVITNEIPKGVSLNESLVKTLTGGDAVAARNMYQSTIEFTFKAKVWMAVNSLPAIDGKDYAMWRRIRCIPMDFHADNPDIRLTEKLLRESRGILNWCVQGAKLYYEEGSISPPAIVIKQADFIDLAYKTSPDGWIVHNIKEGKDTIMASELYLAYKEQCEEFDVEPESLTKFGLALRSNGFRSRRMKTGKFYQNVEFVNLEEDEIA